MKTYTQDILCPKHHISLKLNECIVEVFGTPHICVIGVCPYCTHLYCNRSLFPPAVSCSIDNVVYELNAELQKHYPPCNNKEKLKVMLAERNRIENEKRYIAKLEKDLLSGNHRNIEAKLLRFISQLPTTCPEDDQELLVVNNATIKCGENRTKIRGCYCPKCKTMYALPNQKDKFYEDMRQSERRNIEKQKSTTKTHRPKYKAYIPDPNKAKEYYVAGRGNGIHMITVDKSKKEYIPASERIKCFQGGLCTPK